MEVSQTSVLNYQELADLDGADSYTWPHLA